MSWFNRDWHLLICDSSWIAWFIGLNIHLPFSIIYGSSTPRLSLALLQCMVHRAQVLVNPSSTTILSHTTLHVFHRLILWKPSSFGQVDSIDIQYLDVALDQFFLGQDQAIRDEPNYYSTSSYSYTFLAWLDINSSIWDYLLLNYTCWSPSFICFIIVLQVMYQWILCTSHLKPAYSLNTRY
jgi:hypothetical protein